MKKTYTRKQITEAIKHWQKVLESTIDIKQMDTYEHPFMIRFGWTGAQNGDVVTFIVRSDDVQQALEYHLNNIKDAWKDESDVADVISINKNLDSLQNDIMKFVKTNIDRHTKFDRDIDFGNENILNVTVETLEYSDCIYFCI